MSQLTTHQITVYTACSSKVKNCRPDKNLIERLRTAVAANDTINTKITVAEVICITACYNPCAVAFQTEQKASYVFGDMLPEEDVGDILAFVHQYAQLQDGWCSSVDCPGKLLTNAIARIPAMLFSTQAFETIQ